MPTCEIVQETEKSIVVDEFLFGVILDEKRMMARRGDRRMLPMGKYRSSRR